MDEILKQMVGLTKEAMKIVQSSGNKFEIDRAKAYWYPWILDSLSHSDNSLRDTIKALIYEESEEEL